MAVMNDLPCWSPLTLVRTTILAHLMENIQKHKPFVNIFNKCSDINDIMQYLPLQISFEKYIRCVSVTSHSYGFASSCIFLFHNNNHLPLPIYRNKDLSEPFHM